MSRNDKIDFARLNELTQEFEQMDAAVPESLASKDLDKAYDHVRKTRLAKREIKRFMAQYENIPAGENLALKLKKIRDNYGYNIDLIYEGMAKATGEHFSQEDEGDIDFVDALFSVGTADYVDENFFRRKNEVGSVVVSRNLPVVFTRHLKRVKECYALGLFEATVVYCRAVIECAVHIYLMKSAKSSSPALRENSLRVALRDRAIRNKAYDHNWNEADRIMELANDILHEKDNKTSISENEAYNCIKSTYAFIEDLF